ncbi:MAG: DUF2807 domain-containing protein [Sphingomicrobium sp.]
MRTIPLFCMIVTIAVPATAETRNFGISGYERVRVEGPYAVKLATGVAPFAKASGPSAALERLEIRVDSRTLIIRSSQSAWGGYPGKDNGPVEVTVGTHELESAAVVGAGSLAINRVKGLEFLLNLRGSGTAAIDRADVDRMKVAVSGSGGVILGGSARQLDAVVRGTSSLQAAGLDVKNATIAVEGAASIAARVSDTVSLTGSGSGIVALDGKPACSVKVTGSGSVTGCR